MNGPLDQRRAVVERHDLDAGRQAGLERLDLLLYPGDDVDRADAVARHHDAPDRLVRALDERGGPEGVADLHGGDLSDEDRHSVLGRDDDVLQVTCALDEAEAAHDGPGAAGLDDVAAHVAVAPNNSIHDRRQRDFVGAEPVRIHVDLVLADHASDASDLRHALDGVELVADEPVLDGAEIAKRVALALDRVPEDVAHAGRIGTQRRYGARGQRFAQELQSLEHPRAREVEVDVVLEDHVDHRETERRRRSDHPHARQPLQAYGQGIGDLVLDLLRRASRPVGEDDDLVVGQVRNRVDRRREQGPVAPAPEEQEAGDDEQAIPQRQLDEPVDHAHTSVASRARRNPRATRYLS